MKNIVVLLIILFSSNLKAQFTNYFIGSYNQSSMVERERYSIPLALGGNYTGLAIGPEAQYYNPAGLCYFSGLSSVQSFYYTRDQYSSNINYYLQGSIAYSKKKNAFSGGYFFNPKGNREYSGLQLSVDYSRKITSWLAASFSMFYLPNEVAYYKTRNELIKINPLAFGVSLFGQRKLKKGIIRYGFTTKNLSYQPYILSSYTYSQTENYPLILAAGGSYEISFSDTLRNDKVKERLRFIVCSDFKYSLQRVLVQDRHYDTHSFRTGVGVWIILNKIVDIAGSVNFYSNPDVQNIRFGLGFHAEQLFSKIKEKDRIAFGISVFFNDRLLGTNGNQNINTNWVNTITIGFNYAI
jgi:hypothetical protein